MLRFRQAAKTGSSVALAEIVAAAKRSLIRKAGAAAGIATAASGS
jgi:hypothetical protein